MTDSHQGLPFPRRTYAVISLSLASLVTTIDASISSVVLPTIAKALQVESSASVLVVTVYQLILAMALLPFSALGERIGHRRVFQAGLCLYSIAAVLCLSTRSLPMLIVVRSLQALGCAAALSTSVGILRRIYPVVWLGRGLAINTVANSLGSAASPIIAGFIISLASWQWVFAAALPLALFSLLLSRRLPEPEPHAHRFDLRGAALCALTFGLLFSGMESAVHGHQMPLSIGIFIAGIVVAYFFVRHEKGESEPVLPVDLLSNPMIGLSVLAGFTGIISVMVMLLALPFRLQQVYGFSPTEIGGVIAAYMVMTSAISSLSGFIADRIPMLWLSIVGLTLAAISQFFIAFIPAQPNHFDLVWPMCVSGLGFGLFFAPNVRQVVMASPAKRSASAASLNNTVRMLGYAVSASLVTALLAFKLGESSVPGLLSIGFTVITLLICVVIPRRKK